MSDTPADETSTEPSPTAPARTLGWLKPPHWSTYAALAVALIAVGLAIVGWFRPPPHQGASPGFANQHIDEAKRNICVAYTAVHQGVFTNTHMTNPVPGDQIGGLAVQANARLALYAGGGYLRERLAAEPATPSELAKAITTMANTLQELSIGYLAGAPDFTQDPLRRDYDSEIEQVAGLCK